MGNACQMRTHNIFTRSTFSLATAMFVQDKGYDQHHFLTPIVYITQASTIETSQGRK